MLVTFCDFGIQTIDLAVAGVAQGISLNEALDIQMQVWLILFISAFTQQVLVGDFDFQPFGVTL